MFIGRSIHHKAFNRFRIIFAGGVSTVVKALGNVLVALLVVKLFSETLWGQFVFYLLAIDLAFNLINWGHRSYLIREFSLKPDKLNGLWQQSFTSRIVILVSILIVLIIIPFSIYLKFAFILWGISRYIYQSFEPVIAYKRNYLIATTTEFAGLLIIILPLLIFTNFISFEVLIYLFSISFLFKSIVILYFYRAFLSGIKFNINKTYFSRSLPFLLTGISGLLVSRADLYIVAAFLEPSALAQYQILISLLLFSHFGASILIAPFEKNIYRLNKNSLKKLQKLLIISGLGFSIALIIIIYLIINYIFNFTLPNFIYLAGIFYIYIFFIYQVRMYQFAKNQNQKFVTSVIFIGGIINLLIALILIPIFELNGAILAAVTAQLFIALLLNIKNPSKAT